MSERLRKASLSGRSSVTHRIDPRLVHATLLEAWVPHLEATTLVVADAATAHDPRRRAIVELSARDVAAVHIVEERQVAAQLDHLKEDATVIVLYPGLDALSRALDAGLKCADVLLGHLPETEGRRRVHPSVYVGAEDLDWVEELAEQGVAVLVRPLPTDRAMGLRRGDDDRPVLTDDLPAPSEPPVEEQLASPDLIETDPPQPAASQSRSGKVQVVNERGLHLRAAHLLAQSTTRFSATVELGWPGRMVNAKSLLGITTLGAAMGTELELVVQGDDADLAFDEVVRLFAGGFEEGRA